MEFLLSVLLWTGISMAFTMTLDRLYNGVWIEGKWPLFYGIVYVLWWMWIFRDLARSSTG